MKTRFRGLGRLTGLTLVLAGTGCGPSIAVRGGTVVSRGNEPPGDVLTHYRAVDCVDGAGQPTTQRRGNVWLVRGADSKLRLVETLGGHDSLVVENSFVVGSERVFQLSTNALPEPLLWGGRGDDLLFDYRLPLDGRGEGRLGLVTAWREERHDDGSLRGRFDRVALACRLAPDVAQAR